MSFVKDTIKKTLAARGYEISRPVEPAIPDEPESPVEPDSFENLTVRFENFVNLATAYEQCLNDHDELILPDETRPKLLGRLLGTPPTEAYFIMQALSRCKDLPGDVCEFGVAQGETSALIANELAVSGDKIFHMFDSFEGLPNPSEQDQLKDDIFMLGNMQAYTGTMIYPDDMVRSRLEAISFPEDRYLIHKGFIEDLINEEQVLPKAVSFAYVDFDFYEPIKVTLEYLHRVTPNGAVIIVDDYDFFSTGAKTAVDEFIEAMSAGGSEYDCLVPDKSYGYFAVLTKKG